MTDPAQSPQGVPIVAPPKSAMLSKLRSNFATSVSSATDSVPPSPAKPDLVEKLFAPASPTTDQVPEPTAAQTVSAPVASKPTVETSPVEENFSTDFLNDLIKEKPLAAALPTAVAQAAASNLNPAQPTGGTVKEVLPFNTTIEAPQVDVSPGVQYVEIEPNVVEMPLEVESFLTQVENHQEQLPQEIVVAANEHNAILQPLPQPVVVLPITPEIEKQGSHKSADFSVRWLVEWSRKVIKMFTGRVVYRTAS